MTLYLLIDTSVWLDLAKDYRQLPIIDALTFIWEANDLELILPSVVVEEWERNKERVIAESKQSLSSHFKRVREAVNQFAAETERAAVLAQLSDVDHRISIGGEAINDAIEQIERLFSSTEKLEISEFQKARAADRAMAKKAPFHRPRNSIADALLIEAYIDALANRTDDGDVYAFVTHNKLDFSDRDPRQPHPDFAPLFDGIRSKYIINLAELLEGYAHELVEEVRFEREVSQTPRRLSEILEAEHKLVRQVWYNRKWNIISRVEEGVERIVSQEEYDNATPEERCLMTTQATWDRMLAAMKGAEEELGPDDIGPWSDFEWGMLNGKLSALRWITGEEWDMLDT